MNIIYRARNAVTTVVCVSGCRESHSAKITFGDTNYVICNVTSSVIFSKTPHQTAQISDFQQDSLFDYFLHGLDVVKAKKVSLGCVRSGIRKYRKVGC